MKLMKIKSGILLFTLLGLAAANNAMAADINNVTLTAIVNTVNVVTINNPIPTGFGTVDLDANRLFIGGTAAGSTSTPNSPGIAAANDPWLLTPALKINMTFKNNSPGELYIYTKHAAQSYFGDVDVAGLATTTNLSGLLHVGDNTPGNGRKDSRIASQNAYLTTVPIRAWVDANNAGAVTTNPTADWIWITDVSKAYNNLNNSDAASDAAKQKLVPYSLISKDSMDVYLRAAFSWPKLPGTYIANVIIEFFHQ